MDDWKKFSETSLPEKEDFYGHAKRADVFENFRNMCLKIYELDPVKFLSAPGLACQVALEKTKVKLDLLADIDMLLMVEKGIRGGICPPICQYANTGKIMIKIKNRHIFNIGM